MTDSAALYISIGSLLVAIGSLVVSIATRQEARHHTVFTPRTQALDYLRIAVNDIKRVRRVTPSAVLIMRDAKSRADLTFDEKVRSDLDRVIQIGDRLQFQLLRANFARLESGGIPNALSMSESAGIDSFFGASDAEALFHRLACPSD